MPDEWFVRVHGKEYGPVELEELREWRAEGRLIPDNEVRLVGDTQWRKAEEFVEIFTSVPPPLPTPVQSRENALFRRRSLLKILADAFRIYARNFLTFFGLALIVAIPSLALRVSLAFVRRSSTGMIEPDSRLAAVIAAVSFSLLAVAWPLFLAAIQFATADVVSGRRIRLADLLARAKNIWPRMAKLSLLVYGSYIIWTLPVLVLLGLAQAEPSVTLALLTLFALGVQVFMVGRLFINFLFWQQSATIGGLEGLDAIRESTQLARSNRLLPMSERPVFRGATLASLWLAVLLGFSMVVELPFMLMRLQGITTVEEASDLVQKLVNAPAPDTMTLVTYVLTSLVSTLLRPLLAISFVLLYFDVKARQ